MKLEPVFLVAPKVSAGSVPSRRAFLFAGAAFFGGAVLGTACGYSLGIAAAPPSPPEPATPAKTGNNELDELRRLAVTAPIEELVDKHPLFLVMRERQYSDDEVLWRGVARLAAEALNNSQLAQRRQIAKLVMATLQAGTPPRELGLQEMLPELKKVGR